MVLTISALELLCAAVDEKQEEQVNLARAGVMQLYGAYRRLSLVCACEKGSLETETGVFCLNTLLYSICEELQTAGEAVSATADAAEQLNVSGDAEAVELILWQLIGEMVLCGCRSVVLRAAASDGRVRVQVTGEGAGDPSDPADAARRRSLAQKLAALLEAELTVSPGEAVFFLPRGPMGELRTPDCRPLPGLSSAETELPG